MVPRTVLVLLLLLLLALEMTPVAHAQGTTFTVNSTADPGNGVCDATECTLREAINAANANSGTDTIAFNIPTSDPGYISTSPTWWRIQPASALPTITDPMVIDGYTQPGASPNTNPVGQGLNTVLKIELDGSNAVSGADGLHITAGGSNVKGLVINRFRGVAGGERAGVGVHFQAVGGNSIEGSFIGTDISGTISKGNDVGIWIDSSPNNRIGGTTAQSRNLISGNQGDNFVGVGISINGDNATENLVLGNFIGTTASGSEAMGNGTGGNGGGIVVVNFASNNTIGGMLTATRNVISGNVGLGIGVENWSQGNLIQGNFIGTDVSGQFPLGNVQQGVLIIAPNNLVGGTTPGEGNVISDNGQDGVFIWLGQATGNRIQGNFIGTDATGTGALGNLARGVRIEDAPNNVIGGATSGARNVISGNRFQGVFISGTNATGNILKGNYIGTDVNGNIAIANSSEGVAIKSSNNIVGGIEPGEGNLISGNEKHGVGIQGSEALGNVITGNFIGTNASGLTSLANGVHGISIDLGANNNTIGGVVSGAGNIIAFNAGDGVAVETSSANSVLGNSIFSNTGSFFGDTGLGIDLGVSGITSNDSGDADMGANNLQNFPVLPSSQTVANGTKGGLNSTPNTAFRLEFFSSPECDPSGFGEGKTFLAFTSVITDGSGDAPFNVTFSTSVPVGYYITSTATDPDGNTSEFSQCALVLAPPPTPTPVPGVTAWGLAALGLVLAALLYLGLRARQARGA